MPTREVPDAGDTQTPRSYNRVKLPYRRPLPGDVRNSQTATAGQEPTEMQSPRNPPQARRSLSGHRRTEAPSGHAPSPVHSSRMMSSPRPHTIKIPPSSITLASATADLTQARTPRSVQPHSTSQSSPKQRRPLSARTHSEDHVNRSPAKAETHTTRSYASIAASRPGSASKRPPLAPRANRHHEDAEDSPPLFPPSVCEHAWDVEVVAAMMRHERASQHRSSGEGSHEDTGSNDGQLSENAVHSEADEGQSADISPAAFDVSLLAVDIALAARRPYTALSPRDTGNHTARGKTSLRGCNSPRGDTSPRGSSGTVSERVHGVLFAEVAERAVVQEARFLVLLRDAAGHPILLDIPLGKAVQGLPRQVKYEAADTCFQRGTLLRITDPLPCSGTRILSIRLSAFPISALAVCQQTFVPLAAGCLPALSSEQVLRVLNGMIILTPTRCPNDLILDGIRAHYSATSGLSTRALANCSAVFHKLQRYELAALFAVAATRCSFVSEPRVDGQMPAVRLMHKALLRATKAFFALGLKFAALSFVSQLPIPKIAEERKLRQDVFKACGISPSATPSALALLRGLQQTAASLSAWLQKGQLVAASDPAQHAPACAEGKTPEELDMHAKAAFRQDETNTASILDAASFWQLAVIREQLPPSAAAGTLPELFMFRASSPRSDLTVEDARVPTRFIDAFVIRLLTPPASDGRSFADILLKDIESEFPPALNAEVESQLRWSCHSRPVLSELAPSEMASLAGSLQSTQVTGNCTSFSGTADENAAGRSTGNVLGGRQEAEVESKESSGNRKRRNRRSGGKRAASKAPSEPATSHQHA